jgi:DNA primase
MAKTLLDIFSEEKFEITSSGDKFKISCPFHKGDDDPSLVVYPNDTYYCFACEAWGDALKFLVDYKGWSADEAKVYLGDDYVPRQHKRLKVIKVKNTNLTWEFLYNVADTYHDYLLQTYGAINYLLNRGLTLETIKKYKIGYTDGAVLKLGYAAEYDLASEAGILSKGGYEIMSHRITIPNLLDNHYCDFITGRTILNEKPKYLNTTGFKPIHGFYEVRHSPILFLAEGQFDYLTLRQWGIPSAVLGGSNLKKSQYSLLKEKKLVILPDYDENNHGLNVAKGLADRFKENSIILDYRDAFNLSTNEKIDISSLATVPGAQEKFYELIKERVPWIIPLSKTILAKWFPDFLSTMHSHLT